MIGSGPRSSSSSSCSDLQCPFQGRQGLGVDLSGRNSGR